MDNNQLKNSETNVWINVFAVGLIFLVLVVLIVFFLTSS